MEENFTSCPAAYVVIKISATFTGTHVHIIAVIIIIQ